MNAKFCPICHSDKYSIFHNLPEIPVHVGVLWPSRQAALDSPKGDVALAYCSDCGFINNQAFAPDLVNYTLSYDNALHFSGVFQAYERDLAQHLIDKYKIRNRDVIEIGCGSGHFLGLLAEIGNNRGYGFDPSHEPEKADARAKACNVEFVRDYYTEKYTEHPADLICCRHVMEHIEQPLEFLQMIRAAVADRTETVLYFEVPNARLILDKLSIWDVMYEHCDYFTIESMGYLFETCGFEVLDLRETYDSQFVSIEVQPAISEKLGKRSAYGDLNNLEKAVSGFGPLFNEKKQEWQESLGKLKSAGKKAVVWGGGGKAVGFLNMLDIGDQIQYVIDVNPGKQGTFLTGGGQAIMSPEFLKEYQPNSVIIMNPVYFKEISENIQALGVKCEILNV